MNFGYDESINKKFINEYSSYISSSRSIPDAKDNMFLRAINTTFTAHQSLHTPSSPGKRKRVRKGAGNDQIGSPKERQ